MQGMRLLLTNQVDHRTAALLFYALQTASSNLSRTTFEPRPQQVVIDPSSIPDTSLGDDAWYKEEFTRRRSRRNRGRTGRRFPGNHKHQTSMPWPSPALLDICEVGPSAD